MVRPEWSAIAPLRVADFACRASDRYPSVATDRFALLEKGVLKPRNHRFRLWLGRAVAHVVVRKRKIEGFLPRGKIRRDEIAPFFRIWIVGATKALPPFRIPRARQV